MFRQRCERRRAAVGRGLAGLATIALVFGLTAASAAAQDRYVTPSGLGALCAQFSPCSLDAGINEAVSGDTVFVAGDQGAYLGESASLTVPPGVNLIGVGAQVPRIVFVSTGYLSLPQGASATGLDLSRATGGGVVVFVSGTASRLRVESQVGVAAQVIGLLRDSFVHATAAPYQAISARGEVAELHNVTAVADGAGARAIHISSKSGGGGTICEEETSVELRNVIARGAGSDLSAFGDGLVECTATFNVGHSNYRSSAVSLNGSGGAALLDQGGNQTGVEPLLAPDRFHQLAGSPTIDAGFVSLGSGPTDIDGEPRSQGSVPDIGADEFPPPPQPPTDTSAPVGSRLRFTPRLFRPKRKRGPSIAAASAKKRRKRSRRTSRVSYRLSEDARVRFTVRRRRIGRRKGKRCLLGKRARRRRKAKKCKRFVRVRGAFTHTGSQGANRFRFSGYVRGRRLRPGAYRMVGVPTDAAGNHGHRFGASFVIARR